jgi:hypothetical protein
MSSWSPPDALPGPFSLTVTAAVGSVLSGDDRIRIVHSSLLCPQLARPWVVPLAWFCINFQPFVLQTASKNMNSRDSGLKSFEFSKSNALKALLGWISTCPQTHKSRLHNHPWLEQTTFVPKLPPVSSTSSLPICTMHVYIMNIIYCIYINITYIYIFIHTVYLI